MSLKESLKNDQVLKEIKLKTFDTVMLEKVLNIIEAFLSLPSVTSLNPMLRTLKETIIQEVLMHDDEIIKSKALICYGLCCVIDLKTAETGIHLFCAFVSF